MVFIQRMWKRKVFSHLLALIAFAHFAQFVNAEEVQHSSTASKINQNDAAVLYGTNIQHDFPNIRALQVSIDNLQKSIDNQKRDLKEEMSRLKDEVLNSHKRNSLPLAEQVAVGFLQDAALSKAEQLSHEVFKTDYPFSCIVYKTVIEMIWDKMTVPEALNRADQRLVHLIERMAVHEAIINKLEQTGQFNTTLLLDLARHMKQILNDSAYNRDVPQEWRSRYEDLKNKLPLSARNLVFSSKVCIKNTAYNEYLYASESFYFRDALRRYIHSAPFENASQKPNCRWTVQIETTENKVYFLNDEFKEYLYSDKDASFDDQSAFTHLSKQRFLDSAWVLEIDGDGVYLKNYFEKYLFAMNKRVHGIRYVFTHRYENTKTTDSKWEIVDCS